MIVSGAEEVDPGTYELEVSAVSGDITRLFTVEYVVVEPLIAATLVTPANLTTSYPTQGGILEWENLPGVDSYSLQVSTEPGFQSNVVDVSTLENIYDLPDLSGATVYYWRVKGINNCEEGEYSPIYAFQTIVTLDCTLYESGDSYPIAINGGNLEISSTIDVEDDDAIFSLIVDLNITHEWVGDIEAFLTGPNGNRTTLFDRPGAPSSTFGCDQSDILVTLFDQAELTGEDLENTCESTVPSISGEFQPFEPFQPILVNQGWVLGY